MLKVIKKETNGFWKLRDKSNRLFEDDNVIKEILRKNHQFFKKYTNRDKLLNMVTECFYFIVLEKCLCS